MGLAILSISSTALAVQLPPLYSAVGLFTVYPSDPSEAASSSLLVDFKRNSVLNVTMFKYDLDPTGWAQENGYLFHMDVIKKEDDVLYDYFWYEDSEGRPQECSKSAWTGSSNRTPFYDLAVLPQAVLMEGERLRGVDTSCYTSDVSSYGPVKQCYYNVDTPWVFLGTGECCPGDNRWDFGNFLEAEKFPNDTFDVPEDCPLSV